MKAKYLIILLLLSITSFVVYWMVKLEKIYLTPKVVTVEKPVPEQIDISATLEAVAEKATAAELSFRTSANRFESLVTRQDREGNVSSSWHDFFVKGVNLGAALPGKYPSEFVATARDYFRWFKLMGEAGFNVVRVYTILPPLFYEALAKYNFQCSKNRIYLIQGIWASLPGDNDYFDDKYVLGLKREIRNAVDVIFGRAVLPEKPGHASGTYIANVSEFTFGFIFGREWEPKSVYVSDSLNSETSSFNGEFFSVPRGTPMEVWLAQMMNFLIKYETITCDYQHPVSFVSWLPLDPMWHASEFTESKKIREYDNDLLTVDPTRIFTTPLNVAGYFSSYHVYPYYPDFIINEETYCNYEGRLGKDNFAGYLHDLKSCHKGMPLLIAEFGLPSSRGISHFGPYGMNQGGYSEREQGELDFILFQDICDEGCAGGILFSWLDEWFKKNWLVQDFEKPEHRNKLWHNVQDPEQNYGLVSFSPNRIRIDGETDDWETKPFASDRHGDGANSMSDIRELYVDSDAEYLYLRIDLGAKPDWSTMGLILAFDTYDEELGDSRLPYLDLETRNGTEFLLHIEDTSRANLLVDKEYEVFSNPYWDYKPAFRSASNSDGVFVDLKLLANRQRISLDGHVFPEKIAYPGRFVYGNQSSNSLADWCSNDATIEIRVPWNIINVTDPSSHSVLHNDPETPDMDFTNTSGIAFSLITYRAIGETRFLSDVLPGHRNKTAQFTRRFTWETWEAPTYKEKLKQSYHVLKKELKTIESDDSLRDESVRQRPPGAQVPDKSIEVSVTPFSGDAKGAVSITFDDGTYHQYQYGLPFLLKYDLSASFGIVQNWMTEQPRVTQEVDGLAVKRFGFGEARELVACGSEISGHGRTHRPDLYRLPEDSIFAEFRDVKQYLEKHVNTQVLSFHYPYTQIRGTTERAARKAKYYVARIGGDTYNDPNNYNAFQIRSFAILNDTTPSLPRFSNIISQARNKWLVLMYHHIFPDNCKEMKILREHDVVNTHAVRPATFERHMRMIRNSGLWVAPMSVVARYIDERKQARIALHESERSCLIRIEGVRLSPLIQVPLTLKATLPWNWARVTGSLHDGIYQVRDGQILIEVKPDREILIERLDERVQKTKENHREDSLPQAR